MFSSSKNHKAYQTNGSLESQAKVLKRPTGRGTHLVVLVHGIVEIEANGMVVATVQLGQNQNGSLVPRGWVDMYVNAALKVEKHHVEPPPKSGLMMSSWASYILLL